MWKFFWIFVATSLCGTAAAVWLSLNSTFLFHHPKNPDARVIVDPHTGGAVLVGFRGNSAASEDLPHDDLVPRAEVLERDHDFGVMNPLTMGRHEFVIRNAGTAPLTLRIGPTTCKCTLAGLEKKRLAPGEQTTIGLEWNSGRDYHFEHSGTVFTSDPDQRSIELRIRGRVIAELLADVTQIVIPPMAPESSATSDVLVYSQVFDQFEITDVECHLEGTAWQIVPFDSAAAPELAAKAVQCLRLTVSGDRPTGDFTGTLRMTASVPAENSRRHLDLPLHGSVLERMELIGGNVDPFGNIDLGSLQHGSGKRVRLQVKVRDSQPQIDNAKITVFPEFLQARLTPHHSSTGRGLYELVIEVPPTAPVCQYRGHPRAEVRVDTCHPRLGNVKLGVTFAVLPRTQLLGPSR
jgi:hypothetical protein